MDGQEIAPLQVVACHDCGTPSPPPEQTCDGQDHFVGTVYGCENCGRPVEACIRRPCSARREGTDMDDQVKRRARFEHQHPEWQIISPSDIRSILRGETEWRALGPGGLIRARELEELLDRLEADDGQP